MIFCGTLALKTRRKFKPHLCFSEEFLSWVKGANYCLCYKNWQKKVFPLSLIQIFLNRKSRYCSPKAKSGNKDASHATYTVYKKVLHTVVKRTKCFTVPYCTPILIWLVCVYVSKGYLIRKSDLFALYIPALVCLWGRVLLPRCCPPHPCTLSSSSPPCQT